MFFLISTIFSYESFIEETNDQSDLETENKFEEEISHEKNALNTAFSEESKEDIGEKSISAEETSLSNISTGNSSPLRELRYQYFVKQEAGVCEDKKLSTDKIQNTEDEANDEK